VSEWRRDASPAAMPSWILPASVGSRTAAWLIDALLMGLLGLIPAGVAVAAGGLAWNPEALSQVNGNPFGTPSVPWLVVQTGPLVASAALWIVITVAYGAIGWRFMRGQPGQRMRSIEVADAGTGRNLPAARALLRAALVNGIPAAATAALAVSGAELMAIVPANATSNSTLLRSGDAATWAMVSSMSVLTGAIWAAAVLLSTSSNSRKRGLPDRMSGSIVVRLPPRFGPWGPYPSGLRWPGWYGPGAGPNAGAASGPGYPWPGGPGSEGAPGGPGPTGPVGPGFVWPPPAGGGWPAQPQAPTPPVWTGLAPWGAPAAPDEKAGETEPDSEPAEGSGSAAEGAPRPGTASPPSVEATERPEAAPEEKAPSGLLDQKPAARAGRPGSELPEGLRVASYRRRMAAYGLDSILVLTAYSAIQMVVAPTDPTGELAPERSWMLAGLLGGLLQAVYFVGGWWLLRGTFWQKALSLQVGRETTGKRLGPVDALVRWAVLQGPVALWLAVPYVMSVLLLVVVVGWMVVLSRSARDDPDGRGYHDRLAGSMVVEEV
jgi:hypothetical protein